MRECTGMHAVGIAKVEANEVRSAFFESVVFVMLSGSDVLSF